MQGVIHFTDSYFNFVNQMDPRLLDTEAGLQKVLDECKRLQDRLQQAMNEMREAWDRRSSELQPLWENSRLQRAFEEKYVALLQDAKTKLEAFQEAVSQNSEASKATMKKYHAQLSRNFADWVNCMEKLPSAKEYILRWRSYAPVNYHRNIYHIINGMTGALLYQFVLERETGLVIVGSMLALFIFLDRIRRINDRVNTALLNLPYLKLLVRPREWHQVPSAVYYAAGVFLSGLFFPKISVVLGLAVLAIGDPAASTIGKRVRSPKIWGEKTLGGFLGFLGAGFLVSLAFVGFAYSFSPLMSVAIALTAAVSGGVAELTARKIDDNFSVIVATSFAVWVVLMLAGLL